MNNYRKVYTYSELDQDQQCHAACLHDMSDDDTRKIVFSLYVLDSHGIPELFKAFSEITPVISNYIELLEKHMCDDCDFYNLLQAMEIVKQKNN